MIRAGLNIIDQRGVWVHVQPEHGPWLWALVAVRETSGSGQDAFNQAFTGSRDFQSLFFIPDQVKVENPPSNFIYSAASYTPQ